jgi:hypothetical protein
MWERNSFAFFCWHLNVSLGQPRGPNKMLSLFAKLLPKGNFFSFFFSYYRFFQPSKHFVLSATTNKTVREVVLYASVGIYAS